MRSILQSARSAAQSAWILGRISRRLRNWQPVWSQYLSGRPVPALEFRNGVRLTHTPRDAPVPLLFEVFADGIYRKYLPRRLAGTVIDIGANIGATSIDFASRFPNLLIEAYEPDPSTRKTLEQNITLNNLEDRVRVHPEAVGRSVGNLRMWINGPSVFTTAYAANAPAGCDPLDVSMIGLTDVLARVQRFPIVLLKIDAEGAESDILEGAGPNAMDRVRNVALEYHTDLCADANSRCRSVLEHAGFSCREHRMMAKYGMLYALRK